MNRSFSKDYKQPTGTWKGAQHALIIREMHVKTTMKYNFTNLRMAITKREETSVGKDTECCGNTN